MAFDRQYAATTICAEADIPSSTCALAVAVSTCALVSARNMSSFTALENPPPELRNAMAVG